MKKNAFMLSELIVSIAFTSVVSIVIINTALNIKSILQEAINYKIENEDKTTIYNDLATKFSTRNIVTIESITDGYKITYSKNSVYGSTVNESENITLNNGELLIDGQVYRSSSNIEYKKLDWKKVPVTDNKYYLKLIIEVNMLDKPSNIEIYYLNDNPTSIPDNIT